MYYLALVSLRTCIDWSANIAKTRQSIAPGALRCANNRTFTRQTSRDRCKTWNSPNGCHPRSTHRHTHNGLRPLVQDQTIGSFRYKRKHRRAGIIKPK